MSNELKIVREFDGGSMARTFLIEKNGIKNVRKVVEIDKEGLGYAKLYEQWLWMFNFNKKYPRVFPDVKFMTVEKNKAWYDMAYFNMPTLRDSIIKNSIEEIQPQLIGDVLAYGTIIAKPVEDYDPRYFDSYFEDEHLNKWFKRLECMKTFNILTNKNLHVNGKKVKTIYQIAQQISEDEELLELLNPSMYYNSHGDFTLQNVLTDDYEIRVIDPRGGKPDSIYYDISKLFQSTHGKYDLLYEGNVEYEVSDNPDHFNFNIKEHEEKFELAYNILRQIIPLYYPVHEEWEIIAKIFEGSHFISMAPFRLKEMPIRAELTHAIGLKILTEALEEWQDVKQKRTEKQESTSI